MQARILKVSRLFSHLSRKKRPTSIDDTKKRKEREREREIDRERGREREKERERVIEKDPFSFYYYFLKKRISCLTNKKRVNDPTQPLFIQSLA